MKHFPHFEKIDDLNLEEYLALYSKIMPYCDYSYNNLKTWLNLNNDLEVSRINSGAIFRYSNPFSDKNNKVISLFTLDDINTLLNEIFCHKIFENISHIDMIPESCIKTIDRELYGIQEEYDNMNYIYSTEEWRRLSGKKFSSIRWEINKASKIYSNSLVHKKIPLKEIVSDRKIIDKIEAFILNNRNDSHHLEARALNNLFKNKSMEYECVLYYLGSDIVSIIIYHYPPHQNTVIFNHLKYSKKFPGIFNLTFHLTILNYIPTQIKQFNAEQDLGIEGIRKHKMLMRPSSFLRTYTVFKK